MDGYGEEKELGSGVNPKADCAGGVVTTGTCAGGGIVGGLIVGGFAPTEWCEAGLEKALAFWKAEAGDWKAVTGCGGGGGCEGLGEGPYDCLKGYARE